MLESYILLIYSRFNMCCAVKECVDAFVPILDSRQEFIFLAAEAPFESKELTGETSGVGMIYLSFVNIGLVMSTNFQNLLYPLAKGQVV